MTTLSLRCACCGRPCYGSLFCSIDCEAAIEGWDADDEIVLAPDVDDEIVELTEEPPRCDCAYCQTHPCSPLDR